MKIRFFQRVGVTTNVHFDRLLGTLFSSLFGFFLAFFLCGDGGHHGHVLWKFLENSHAARDRHLAVIFLSFMIDLGQQGSNERVDHTRSRRYANLQFTLTMTLLFVQHCHTGPCDILIKGWDGSGRPEARGRSHPLCPPSLSLSLSARARALRYSSVFMDGRPFGDSAWCGPENCETSHAWSGA